MNVQKLKGNMILLLTAFIWGVSFIAQSKGVEEISPLAFNGIRSVLGGVVLLPVIYFLDRSKKKKSIPVIKADKTLLTGGVICGICLCVASTLQTIGMVYTSPGKSGFLTAMYIVIVPVMGIFLKRKPTILVPISVVLAVAGLYFLSCMGVTQISVGDLLTIACAFMFAVQIIMVDLIGTDVDALRLNTIQALVCTVLSTGVMLFTETPTWQSIAGCALPLAHAGFLSMGAAYSLQIMGQRDVEPTTASLLMSLESVFAVIFGALILKESMTKWEIIGCVLVFAAVILSQIPIKTKEAAK